MVVRWKTLSISARAGDYRLYRHVRLHNMSIRNLIRPPVTVRYRRFATSKGDKLK
jgi:hypothetical protein